jgi:hypothetical protein
MFKKALSHPVHPARQEARLSRGKAAASDARTTRAAFFNIR